MLIIKRYYFGILKRNSFISNCKLFLNNPELIIGLARLLTSIFASIALYLDPTHPDTYSSETHAILGIYTVLSLTLVMFPLRGTLDSPIHVFFHLLDAALLGWLAFLTDELASPFFSFLPFVILAMTLRWGLKGAIGGALVLEVVLVVVGWPDLQDGRPELNIFIMRAAYFIVAACMLGYLGAYRERSRKRFEQLADWPRDLTSGDREAWLSTLCCHASSVFGGATLLVIWRDQKVDEGDIALWDGETLLLNDLREQTLSSEALNRMLVAISQRRAEPLKIEAQQHLAMLLGEANAFATSAAPPPCGMSYSGVRYQSAVIVGAPHCPHDECLALTSIISARIGSELERLASMQEIATTAREQERSRLARDLHDSILQDLTAASLKLKLIEGSGDVTRLPSLREVHDLIRLQQKRIRKYVERNRDADLNEDMLIDEVLELTARVLERKWGCSMSVGTPPTQRRLPKWLIYEINQLLSEATANSIRHGCATHINLSARIERQALVLTIEDNGQGIAGLSPLKFPLSLKSRVAHLGGRVAIENLCPGLRVAMSLPIESVPA